MQRLREMAQGLDIVDRDDDGEDPLDYIPSSAFMSPYREALLEELPFGVEQAMNVEYSDAPTKGIRIRRTTEDLLDEAIGMKGASRMIREALQ